MIVFGNQSRQCIQNAMLSIKKKLVQSDVWREWDVSYSKGELAPSWGGGTLWQ